LAFSYWTDKPWFLTKGKLLLCSSYLPLGVPNWSVIYIYPPAPSQAHYSSKFVNLLLLLVNSGKQLVELVIFLILLSLLCSRSASVGLSVSLGQSAAVAR
jgi:hypothetical protein